MHRRLIALAMAMVWRGALDAGAHTRVRAATTTDPAPPVAGEGCTIEVRFLGPTGGAVPLPGWRVDVVADMTGHPMRPVEATLVPDAQARVWRARVTFTMAGTWRLTIRAAGGHDQAAGVTSLDVVAPDRAGEAGLPRGPVADAAARQRAGPAARAGDTTVVIPLDTPEAPLAVSPWAVLGGALGLTLLLETLAVVRAVRLRRRG